MVKTISCQEALSKLQAYLDEELGPDAEQIVDHHIHNCRECFSRTEFEKSLRKRVESAASKKVPEDVQKRLDSLIKRF